MHKSVGMWGLRPQVDCGNAHGKWQMVLSAAAFFEVQSSQWFALCTGKVAGRI